MKLGVKKYISLFILLLVIITLSGCNSDKIKKKMDDIFKPLDIVVDGFSNYDFLCSENASNDVKADIKNLVNKIEDKTGYKFIAYRDNFTREEGRKEVLIGLTNREESIEAHAKIGEHGYIIDLINDCLIIDGSNDLFLALALYEFEELILNDPEYCATNKLSVSVGVCKVKNYDKDIDLTEMIGMKHDIHASITEMFYTGNYDTELTIAQGGTTDGEYIYLVLRDRNDSKARIFKYDLEGNLVKTGDEIYLSHGNDLAYDYEKKLLICAHGVKESNTYSYIDPNTLLVTETWTVEKGGGGSVCYLKSKQMYATSKGGETLSYYDKNFNLIQTYDRVVLDEYTAQGVGNDDKYIYFPMSGSSDNVLDVYDWEGNNVTLIKIDTRSESETMFYADGKYYISFYVNGKGAVVYNMNFTFRFE